MTNRQLLLLSLTLLLIVVSAACATVPQDNDVDAIGAQEPAAYAQITVKTFFVGPIVVDCVGSAPQTCMLVKEDPQEEYTYFYDQIAGFNFESGFVYELLVEEHSVPDPPADASSLKWSLLEIVNKAPASSPLGDTDWSLQSYQNSAGERVDIIPGSSVSARFQSIEVNGNAGCNNYFGSYTIDGERVYTGIMGSTEMFCMEPEGLMDQEFDYLAALRKAYTYQVEGNQLSFSNFDGEIVLIYQIVEPIALVDTNWLLTGYNNGKGGFTSLIIGTQITALFDNTGSLSGSAGCNKYNAVFDVDGDNIQIGPAAMTQRFCGEPDGTMEQESAYLAALESAVNYQIQGEILTMFNSDGGRALSYVVQQISHEDLQNAIYISEWTEDETVQLENGEYREQITPDSASELVVQLTEFYAFGELENGTPAAAAILVTNGGGSGSFYNLALLTKEDHKLVNVAAAPLGDRVQINSVTFENNRIVIDMVTHGDNDPMCCPTEHIIQTYSYNGSELVLENTESASAGAVDPLLLDVIWQWETSLYNNDTGTMKFSTSELKVQT